MRRNGLFRVAILLLSIVAMAVGVLTMVATAEAAVDVDDIAVDDCVDVGYAVDFVDDGGNDCCNDPIILAVDDNGNDCCNDDPIILAVPLGVDDCENQCLDVVDPDVPPAEDCPPDVTCIIEGDIALLVPEGWPCPPPCIDGFYYLPAQYEIPCNDDPPEDICVIEGDIAVPVPSGWPCPPPCIDGFYGFPAPWDDIPCPDVECVLANGVVVMLPPGDPCPPPCVDGWLELPGGVIVSCGDPCLDVDPDCVPDCYKPDPDGNILIIPIGPDGDPVPPCIPDCYEPVAGGGIQIVPIGPDGEPIPECPCPDADPYDGQLPICEDCYKPDPNGGIVIVPIGPDGKPLPPCVPDCYEPVIGGGIQIVPVDDDGNPIPECPCPDADPYDGELPICDPECPDPGYGPNGELVIVDGCPHPCDETIVAVDMDGNVYQVYPLGCDPDPCLPYVVINADLEPEVVIPDNCPEPDCPPIIVIDEWGAYQVVIPDDCPDPCAPVIAVDGDGNEYEVLPLGCDPDPCALQVVVGLDGVPIVVVPDNCPEPDCPPIVVIDADGNLYGVVPDDCPPPPNPCDGWIDIAPNVPILGEDECCKWLYYHLNGDLVDLDDIDQVVLANECCKWLYDADVDLVDVNDQFAPWGCCKLIGVIDADLLDVDNGPVKFPYHCCKALGVDGIDVIDIAPADQLVWPDYCCKAIALHGGDIVDVNPDLDFAWHGWCCKWFYDNVDNVGVDWVDDWPDLWPGWCCKGLVVDGADVVDVDAFDQYWPKYCCKWFADNVADPGADWPAGWPDVWPNWCCQVIDVIDLDNVPINWGDWCGEPPVMPDVVCYSIDHGFGAQHLVKIDVGIPAVVDVDQILPTGQIENIAFNNDTGEIWAYDWQSSPNVMWVYTYDAAGNVIATDQQWTTDDWNGLDADGDDIDAMFWVNDTDDDPANDELWMVVDAANELSTSPPFGWLVQVDPADGSLISGPTEILLPNNGIGWGVEAATWLPATGQFLISYTDTGSQTQLSMLAEIDPLTGVVTDIAPTLVDVEGMGTDGDAAVYITTGEDGPVDNRLWVLNVVTGATGFILDIQAATGDSDYESVDCGKVQVDVPTPQPELEILKTVVWNTPCPATFADALLVPGNPGLDTIQAPQGVTVTYCINAINHGPGDATAVTVSDDFDPQSPRVFGDLAAGDELAFDYDHVTGAPPETNTAKVSGRDADGENPQFDIDQAGTVFDGTGPVGPLCAGFPVTINMQLGDDPSLADANDVILGTNDDDEIVVANAKAICALDGDDKISVGDGVQVVKTLIYSGLGDDGVRVVNGDDAHVWSEGGLDHIEIIS